MTKPFGDHVPLITGSFCAGACVQAPLVNASGIEYGTAALDDPGKLTFGGFDVVGPYRGAKGASSEGGKKGAKKGIGSSVEMWLPIRPVSSSVSEYAVVEGCFGVCGGFLWEPGGGLIIIVGAGSPGFVIYSTDQT